MSPIYEPERIDVVGDSVVVIEVQGPEAFRVLQGTIWATDATGRDLVVSQGEEVVLDGDGKVVISGLQGPAVIEHYSVLQMQWAA